MAYADRYVINPGNIDRANRAIREIKERFTEGKPFQIDFSEPKPLHSDAQRGYYWASLHEFGKFLGFNAKDSEEILHRELKCRYFGVEREISMGGQILQVPKGSSKRLSKKEYSELMDELIILAGEHGFTIQPPPKEQDHGDSRNRPRDQNDRGSHLGAHSEAAPGLDRSAPGGRLGVAPDTH